MERRLYFPLHSGQWDIRKSDVYSIRGLGVSLMREGVPLLTPSSIMLFEMWSGWLNSILYHEAEDYSLEISRKLEKACRWLQRHHTSGLTYKRKINSYNNLSHLIQLHNTECIVHFKKYRVAIFIYIFPQLKIFKILFSHFKVSEFRNHLTIKIKSFFVCDT